MRVTERSRIEAMTLAQSRAATRLDKASRVASTGQRVTKPSDDPAAYGAMVRRNHALEVLEEHATIASRAQGELEVAQNGLSAASDIMARAQEAAVVGSNASSDPKARKLLAETVRVMRDELLAIGNTRYGDKYLFGGTKTDAVPFDPTTGAFSGNDQLVRVPVLSGVAPPSNVSGATAFTSAGGRDIFADLAALATALDANDEAGIRSSLDPLASGHAQLIRSQVDAGFNSERFRSAIDMITTTKSSLIEQLAQVDGDPAAHYTELNLARLAYERSIAVTKSILSISTNSG